MQAVFHSRPGFQADFVVLHASRCMDRQRKQAVVSLWRRWMRFVLPADKTDVEQCLHVRCDAAWRYRDQQVASSPASLWPRWPAQFFLQTKGRVRHAGMAVSRMAGTALKKLRQFSFFS